jgi:hypothetical protein
MSLHAYRWASVSQGIIQRLTLVLILGLAVAATAWSIAAVAGLAPWLEIGISLGGAPVDAGTEIQLVLTLLLLGLCFFVPSQARVMRLENSHREFTVSMRDVARAYQAAHAADREGVFKLKSEFDGVRDRMTYLRTHPDLDGLEPAILEMAAQMSHESRELAEIYSDHRVDRARRFLQQRQEEAEQLKSRIQVAHSTCREIKRWLAKVETEEAVARSRLAVLREELTELLPVLDLAERPYATAELLGIRGIAAE